MREKRNAIMNTLTKVLIVLLANLCERKSLSNYENINKSIDCIYRATCMREKC